MQTLFDPSNPLLQTILARSAKLKPVLELWREAVGDPSAQHSRPVDLNQYGVLTVWTDSSLWATNIRHSEPSIVARLKSRGITQVESLSVKVAPETIPGPEKTRTSVPRSVGSDVAQMLLASSNAIGDGELKTSLLRLHGTLKHLPDKS